MTTSSRQTSIQHLTRSRPKARKTRLIAALTTVTALILIGCAIWTFHVADRIMHLLPRPLAEIPSNDMPEFRPVTFPSLDNQLKLSGWFMPSRKPAAATVVLVHDQGHNRLQFDQATTALYRYLVQAPELPEQSFNVLAFDLRNSGLSEGKMSAYGFSEWSDVIAALRFVQKNVRADKALLYGFGAGCSAALAAWEELPAPGSDRQSRKAALRDLPFDRSYIAGFLFDSPPALAVDPIHAALTADGAALQPLLHLTVPYAVRLSAGSQPNRDLRATITRLPLPVFISAHAYDTQYRSEASADIADTRERILPDMSDGFVDGRSGHGETFLIAHETYLAQLGLFLKRFVTPG